MCKRRSMALCDANNPHCAGSRCKCDSMCKLYNDCCADYDELCASEIDLNKFVKLMWPSYCRLYSFLINSKGHKRHPLEKQKHVRNRSC